MTSPQWRGNPNLPPRPSFVDDRYRPTRHEDRRGSSSYYPSYPHQEDRRQGSNGQGSSRDRAPQQQQPIASSSRLPNRPNPPPRALPVRPPRAAAKPLPSVRAEDHQPNAERQDRRFRTLPTAPPSLMSKSKAIAIPTGPRAQRGRPPPPSKQAPASLNRQWTSGPQAGPSKASLPPRPGSSTASRPDVSAKIDAIPTSPPSRPGTSVKSSAAEAPSSLPPSSPSLPPKGPASQLLPWEKPLTVPSEPSGPSHQTAEQGFVERSMGPGTAALPELPGGLPVPIATSAHSKEPSPSTKANPSTPSVQPNGAKRPREEAINENEPQGGKKAKAANGQAQAAGQKGRGQEQPTSSTDPPMSKAARKAKGKAERKAARRRRNQENRRAKQEAQEAAASEEQSEDELASSSDDAFMASVPVSRDQSVQQPSPEKAISAPLATTTSKAVPQASSPVDLMYSSDGLSTPPISQQRIFATDRLLEPTSPSLVTGAGKQAQSTVKAEIETIAIDLSSDDDDDDDDNVPLSRGRSMADRPESPVTLFNGRAAALSQPADLVASLSSKPATSTATTEATIWRLAERVDRLGLTNFAPSDGGPQKGWTMRWLALLDCHSKPTLLGVTPRGHTSIRYAYNDSCTPTRELQEPSPAATVSDVRKLSKKVVGIASGSHSLVGEGAAQVSLVSAEPRKSGGVQARSIELADRPHVRGGATCIAPFLKVNDALTFVTGGSDGILHGWAYQTANDNVNLSEPSTRTSRLHAIHTQPVVAVETTSKGLVYSASHRNKRGGTGSDVVIFDGNETKLVSSWHTSDLVSGFTPAKIGKLIDMTVLRNDFGQHRLHDPLAPHPAEPVMTFGWYHSSSTTLARLGRPIYHKNSLQCLQGCPDGKIRVWDVRKPREVLEERNMTGSGEPLWDSILVPPPTDPSFANKGPGWFTLSESAVWRGSWESS